MMEEQMSSANGSSLPVESSSSSKKEQVTEIAMTLLAQGRRHLLVGDIPSAISALAESTQLLAEQYGESAYECAESYYYYGMALLEMARTDSDVLGDAVEGDKEEEDSSSDEDDGENENEEDGEMEAETDGQVVNGNSPPNGDHNGGESVAEKEEICVNQDSLKEKPDIPLKDQQSDDSAKGKEQDESAIVKDTKQAPDAECGNGKTEETEKSAGKVAEETKSGIEGKKPKNEAKGKSLKSATPSNSAQVEADGSAVEEDTGDDVTNLQLAWEVFELAKNIYQKKADTDPAAKLRLADSLVRLAEVAIESENYNSAIEDLHKCLEIQIASFPADSRSTAETYYQLGVAYTFTTDFKQAVKSFEAAADVIKLRIENLKNPAEKTPSIEEPRNIFHTLEGEIEELENLLPDIQEKIADTIDLEKEAARKVAESMSNGVGTSTSASADNVTVGDDDVKKNGSPDSKKPAVDISHLIRKKRKPEDVVEAETSAPKKVCSDTVA